MVKWAQLQTAQGLWDPSYEGRWVFLISFLILSPLPTKCVFMVKRLVMLALLRKSCAPWLQSLITWLAEIGNLMIWTWWSLMNYKDIMWKSRIEDHSWQQYRRTNHGGGTIRGRGRGHVRPGFNKTLVECFNCHDLGHFKYECPNKSKGKES